MPKLHPPTPTDPAEKLLQQAQAIVTGARRKSYGTPEDNFSCIGEFWTTFLRRRHRVKNTTLITIDASDVAVMMVLMKSARLAETPAHADSWRDTAGYAACGARASGAVLD